MWHVMIALHAVAGVGASVVGVACLRPGQVHRHRWLPTLLLGLIVALVVFMIGAMVAHWTELPAATQIVFTGLVGLGAYMLIRAKQARTATARAGGVVRPSAVDDIGFLLISLGNGFVIVAALDLGAPPWAVVVLAAAVVVTGRRAVGRAMPTAPAPVPAQPAKR